MGCCRCRLRAGRAVRRRERRSGSRRASQRSIVDASRCGPACPSMEAAAPGGTTSVPSGKRPAPRRRPHVLPQVDLGARPAGIGGERSWVRCFAAEWFELTHYIRCTSGAKNSKTFPKVGERAEGRGRYGSGVGSLRERKRRGQEIEHATKTFLSSNLPPRQLCPRTIARPTRDDMLPDAHDRPRLKRAGIPEEGWIRSGNGVEGQGRAPPVSDG